MILQFLRKPEPNKKKNRVLVCVGRPNPSNPSITFGEQRQDPLSPTDAEALMAVVLSSAHHDINSPRIQTFEAASEFWLVLASSGFLPVSNLEFPGKTFQIQDICGIFGIRCQNICRWGLQNSLKPGNKAFSLPLGWTWSGWFSTGFRRCFSKIQNDQTQNQVF